MQSAIDELRTIIAISHRASEECAKFGFNFNAQRLQKALIDCMIEEVPLDLNALLHSGHASFYHDVTGILCHMKNGKLVGFEPVNLRKD